MCKVRGWRNDYSYTQITRYLSCLRGYRRHMDGRSQEDIRAVVGRRDSVDSIVARRPGEDLGLFDELT
jgi:hypothetical protein